MLGGKPRAQRADAARADNGNADVALFHATCLAWTSRR
jgi:hypothetical protein